MWPVDVDGSGEGTAVAGGAAQNLIVSGRSNKCLIKTQFNFAIGMVTTKNQHIRQTTSNRGAIIETKKSQNAALPNQSPLVYLRLMRSLLGTVPYDFFGAPRKRELRSVRCDLLPAFGERGEGRVVREVRETGDRVPKRGVISSS